jgi:hypothetical protein
MKTALVLALALSSFSLFADPVYDSPKKVVSRIQKEENVRCEYQGASFAVCIGANPLSKVCRSTYTYNCDGESTFTLSLKVKSFYDFESDERVSEVQSINM